jgi:hypothetical protein
MMRLSPKTLAAQLSEDLMRLHRSKPQAIAFIVASALALNSCSREGAPPEHVVDRAQGASISFVNRVWQVERSSGVARGTLYVFLSEGTLLITSPNSKPALGKWKYEDGRLIMIEEGIPYVTDILNQSATEFKIRSHNPGQAVETTLIPAESPPLSKY